MRRTAPLALLLLPLAAGCAGAGDRHVSFGESAEISVPVGAYGSEFFPGRSADVRYTVDEVTSSRPGEVAFTLTVEVPRVGRTLGLGDLAAVCESGGHRGASRSDDPPGEADEGTHSFAMECAVPEDAGEIVIAVEHYGRRLEFTGTPA
ncbi:hypothetical protein SUDANB121_00653 [Nocardiopsis dassonvillei]|uniref:hypothetical protein n=1 Tax=Nocardiopsis dassonvillei TaxID=2014 RepID=UPI003F54EE69